MELHANAPLSPIGQRRVVDRVVVEDWSVTAAAEAAGVSERTVVEHGTHHELLDRGGLYATLYGHQFRTGPAAAAASA